MSRRDAAIEIVTGLLVGLLAADDQLAVGQRDLELIPREPGDGQRDAKSIALAVLGADALDVIWGITVARSFVSAIDQALDLFGLESMDMRDIERKPFLKRPSTRVPPEPS